MTGILVKKPGLLTTLQDAGRFGYQDRGISPSGVMDHLAMKHANLLVGNHLDEAVMEMTLLASTFEFQEDALIAITGAEMGFTINGEPVGKDQTLYLNAGDELSGGFASKGARTYMAIRGGFVIPEVLGSKSTFLRAAIGGFKGRAIRQGDTLTITRMHDWIEKRSLSSSLIDPVYRNRKVRVVLGDEVEAFTDEGMKVFLSSEYSIGNDSDRMGYRLSGPQIRHKTNGDILSGPIQFGSIQVPGNGQPIIMMADRQTTGGYTKIGQVIQMDLPYLAQRKPGDRISFEAIGAEKAVTLWRDYHQDLKEYQDVQRDPLRVDQHPQRLSIGILNENYLVTIRER